LKIKELILNYYPSKSKDEFAHPFYSRLKCPPVAVGTMANKKTPLIQRV